MPKASFAKGDMYAPSGRGFVETVGSKRLGEVTNCVARYLQWQAPKDNPGAAPHRPTSVIFTITPISEDGTPVGEPVEQELVAEWEPKDDSMIKVRPGLADSRDDADVKDTVDENGNLVLGTEGNCLYVAEGMKINMTNDFGTFVVSCQDKGFKPQILGAGYLPDFIGMRAWFDLRARNYKSKGVDKTAQEFIVDSITRYPYETGAQSSAPKKSTAAKAKPAPAPAPAAAAPKVNGAAAAAAAPAAANGNVADLALTLLQAVSKDKSGETMSRQKIVVLAVQKMLKPDSGIGKDQHQALQAQLKDVEWFQENAVDIGVVNSGEDSYMLVGE